MHLCHSIRTECRCQTGRVFFDSGSRISMMTKQKAQELQARLVPCLMSINGVGPAPLTSHFKMTVLLELLHDPDETPVTVSCNVVDHLSPVNNNLNIDVYRKLMKEHKLEGDKAALDILLSHADGYAYRKGPDLPFPTLRCGFVLTKFGWAVGVASLKEGFTTAQARQATVTSIGLCTR